MNLQSTSLRAYHHEIEPTLGDRQQAVLDELGRHINRTNNELANFLGWPINTVTPRIFELRRMGKVVEDFKRPCRITGRTAIAWKVWRGTLF